MVRWWRWGIGIVFILWLVMLAHREAVKRGKKGLAIALPMFGGALMSFLVALSMGNPDLANVFVGLSVVLIAGAIGLLLWQGFR
jgi:hypothetical protein